MGAATSSLEEFSIPTDEGAQERNRMRRSPSAVLCHAVCGCCSSPRIPFETQHAIPCTLPVTLHGREPLSGREYDGVWRLHMKLALRIEDDNALDQWLPPKREIGNRMRQYVRHFIEHHGALSVTAGEEGAQFRPPTVSDVKMDPQNPETPMLPTSEYEEYILGVVCATVGRKLRAQEAGVKLVAPRSSIDSAEGPLPSPLHKVTHCFQRAFRYGPRGLVQRIPVTAFVLDAIAGSGNYHAESRPVDGGLVQNRSSKELVFNPQLQGEVVPGPGGGLVREQTIDSLLRDVGTSVEEVQAAFGGGGFNRWLLSLVQPQGGGGSGSAAEWGMSTAPPAATAMPTELDKSAAKAAGDGDGGNAPPQGDSTQA